jgi:hypothetical protein
MTTSDGPSATRPPPSERPIERPPATPSVRWLNLGVAAAAVMLSVYTVLSIAGRGLFEYWGADFRAFRSAAEVARSQGFAAVYDLDALKPPQRRLVETYAAAAVQSNFFVIPTPYLPPFVAPFLAALAFEPVSGWLLWTTLNAVVLLAYSRRLAKAFNVDRAMSPLVLIVSLPVFLTLAFGQVNVWLAIGFGEFLIALHRRQDVAGGLWLGVLWIKPQVLLLMVLGLVIGRRWRALAGLTLSTALVAGSSLILAGTSGLAALAALWLGYAGDLPTTYPESMMNWRGLMVNLEPILGQSAALVIGFAGMVGTAVLGVWLWRRTRASPDHQTIAAGSYAASSAVAWHAHVHMALPLVALIGNGSVWGESRSRWLLCLGVLPAMFFAVVGLTLGPGSASVGGDDAPGGELAVLTAAAQA